MWLPNKEHKSRACLRWGKQLAVLVCVQVALPLLLAFTWRRGSGRTLSRRITPLSSPMNGVIAEKEPNTIR